MRIIPIEILAAIAWLSAQAPGGRLIVFLFQRPNEVWLNDLTEVRGLFRVKTWKVAAVLDACARLPIAAQVFTHEPTAADCARLVRLAIDRVGCPRYLVSDRGTQFTAKAFARTLGRLGIRHRFGSVGQPSATALLERFWRTLKALTRGDLAARLDLALLYYSAYRPHAGLGGATPAEIYLGIQARHGRARTPARASPQVAGATSELPFDVAFLDRDHHFPVLVRRAA